MGEPVNWDDYRSQLETSAATVEGWVLLDFSLYRYFVSLQRAVGSFRIEYVLVECWSSSSSAA